MPQTVEIPDLGVAEFPDEMTPDEIKGVIQKQFYATPNVPQETLPDTKISAVPSVTDALLHGDIKGAAKTALGKVEGYLTKTEPGAEGKNLYDETVPAFHPQVNPGDEKALLSNLAPGLPPVSMRQVKHGIGTLGDIVHGLVDPMNMALMVASSGVGALPKVGGTLGRIIAGVFAEQAGEGAIKSEIKAANLPEGSAEREAAHFETAGNVAMAGAAGAGAVHGLTPILDRIFGKTPTEPTIAEPVRPATQPEVAPSVETPEPVDLGTPAVPVEKPVSAEPISPAPTEPTIANATGTEAVRATPPAETPSLRAINEEGGLQLNKGNEVVAFIVPNEKGYSLVGPDGILKPEGGEQFPTAAEALNAATSRGMEIDPRVISEYGSSNATPEPRVPGEAAREGTAPPPEESSAPLSPAPEEAGRKFRGPADSFGSEVTPVAAHIINDIGGLMSKSTAKAKGLYQKNPDLWDGAPALDHPTHNKVYGAAGETPDVAAQSAYEEGLISEPSPDALYAAIKKESRTARTIQREERAQREEATQAVPKLRSGEKQGDLLANQTEDLSLVGEKGIDGDKIAAEQAAIEKSSAEAKAIQEKQQLTFGGKFRRLAEEMRPSEISGLGLNSTEVLPRSVVETWADRVRSLVNVGDSVKRFIESSGQRDTVAAKFDAANNSAGYVARQARKHVELAGDVVKGGGAEIRQQAATFVRQANGDKAGMLAKLQTIRGKGYDSIIDYAEKNWDSLEKIAAAAKQGTDAAFNEAESAGVKVDYRDNYVKGAYHDPVTQKVVFDETGGGRGTGTSFKKAKVFNDYAEAIAAGFKPRELRLDVLTESATNSTLRVVNRQKWAQSLSELTMPNGEPAVAPAKENGSAPRGYKPVQVTPGNLVNIHEDLAPTIQALTQDSSFPKLLSHGGAFLKHNILVFDIFHGSRFAQMQAAFEAKIPSYHKGLALLEYANRDLTAAQKHGLITPEEATWARENRPKIEGLISQGLNAGRISDAIYAEAVPLMPGAKQANNFIFQKLSRGVITQSAVYALERNAKLHPDWSLAELNRYTAKEVNTYYRNLGNQGLFKSKTFQDMARALVFAPQWIEGMVRSEGRGYGQLGKLATTGQLGNVGKGMATGLVAYFALAQVVNMLTRGKPTWENDEPGHKLDAWIPDSIQGSNGYFVSPLSVFAETTHDALKYSERGQEPLDVAAQLASNKLHPQIRALRDLFGGKDFFGRPLHGFERVTQALADIAPIPLFARTGGYKGGVERQLLSTVGIKATAAPSATNDVYQLAAEFKRKSGIKVPDQVEESDYAKLRRALQNGDLDLAKSEYDELRKSKTRDKIEDYFKGYTKRAFTGNHALESKFKASLDRGQMDIYNSALREREELGRQFRALRK